MIYIEHQNSHQPASLRRYDSMALAVLAIAKSSHLPIADIATTLEASKPVRLGKDVWRVVSPAEMQRRAGIFAKVTLAMERGEDVDPEDVI